MATAAACGFPRSRHAGKFRQPAHTWLRCRAGSTLVGCRNGRIAMIRLLFGLAVILAANTASAQQPLKIGVVMSYSGQFADPGAQIDNGIKLYMKEHGDSVAGRKIELVRKDNGGVAPDVAKRLSQEVIVRDGADILAGYDLTPNALAAGDVSAQAKKFMVNMNAATAIITTKSPYMVRTSFTVPAVNEALGAW